MPEKQKHRSEQMHESLLVELHRLAALQLRNERPNHTLQPTALVNEAWIVLAKQENLDSADRPRYLAASARIIRRLLIDHARKRKRLKRGGPEKHQISLHSGLVDDAKNGGEVIDILMLEEAMEKLDNLNPRSASVVHLRFFGGLTNQEIADELGVSVRSVTGDWSFARAWLSKELDY